MADPATQIKLTIDSSALSWQDLEDIEDLAGRPIGSELQAQNLSIRTVRALAHWALKKERPGMTPAEFAAIPLETLEVTYQAATPLGSGNRAARRRAPKRSQS
jgi:hypothetical protein